MGSQLSWSLLTPLKDKQFLLTLQSTPTPPIYLFVPGIFIMITSVSLFLDRSPSLSASPDILSPFVCLDLTSVCFPSILAQFSLPLSNC